MEGKYNILLCSKEIQFTEWFKQTITIAMHQHMITDYQLFTYNSVFPITNILYRNKLKYHVYFLDITEDNNLTIQLAELLRDLGIEDSIVFICNKISSSLAGYKVKVLDYLIKPVSQRELEQIIYYDYMNNYKTSYIFLNKNSNLFQINANNIACIEVYNRGIKIYLSKQSELLLLMQQADIKENINLKEKYIFYAEKISVFKKRLCEMTFFQCHQSYIINMNKAVSIRRYTAIVDNQTKEGKSVDISKSNWNKLKEAYLKNRQGYENNDLLLDDDLEMVSAGKIASLYPQLFPYIKNT